MGSIDGSEPRNETHSEGPIARFLTEDHRRLDALLQRAVANEDAIDLAAYAEFRAGLLRHIAMEERILLPAARRAGGGRPLAEAARLRLDHGALAALLVPSPTHRIASAIRTILARHNLREEGHACVYEQCDRLMGEDAGALVETLRAAPAVRLNPHVDSDLVRNAVRDAVTRAGYDAEAMGL